MTVDELNAMSPADAARPLESCCGSGRWVDGMLARRPFETLDDVLDAADDIWWLLGPNDWREAFAHHPRIGERASEKPQSERAQSWSADEQSAVALADDRARDEIARLNRDYEHRFGFIYIVSASGKSPEELLRIARARLVHDADTELRIAAEEQRKITRLRLEKLLNQGSAAS